MVDAAIVDNICLLLVKRYADLGHTAAVRLRQWLSGAIPYAYPEVLVQHLDERHLTLLFDAFWQVLSFGTGGRRGKVGYGANRLNPTTVAMTVQGHCQYLKTTFPQRNDLAVVVANDVRVFTDVAGAYRFLGDHHPLLGVSSRTLGKLACEIYAGNGVTAYFAEPWNDAAVLTTPELSYVIGALGAVGGINLSASHNPPDDNGVKIYDQYGSQPVAPDDQKLVDVMDQATAIHSLPFTQAVTEGLIREIPRRLHEEYVESYVKLYENVYRPRQDIPLVYTPLCGCGQTTVGAVLQRLGFPWMMPPDQGPDGTFAVIPLRAPNPEVPEATQPARTFADAKGANIVLSSDPDADRIGVEVKLPDNSWHHLDGNQIAAILCYFLMLDPQGPQRKGLVIETLVTTKILGKIVEKAGESWLIDDLLVGFKYVADVLKRLERGEGYNGIRCSPRQLVLAAEESHGVICLPSIRDKDSTPACMFLAALYQRLQQEGRTLLDYYIHILEELGGYAEVNRSIMMAGAEGTLKKDRIMEFLRRTPPRTLGGRLVNKVVDYWDQEAFGPFKSKTEELPRNVIQIFTDSFVITVRPSGTEPKLKFYCQLHGEPSATTGLALLQEARKKADAVALQVYNELLSAIELSLSEAALLLPDIIELERKRDFDQHTIGRLHEILQKKDFTSLAQLLSWLQTEASAMVPGTDPLPALKAPLAYLCNQWRAEFSALPVFVELEDWARR